MVVGRDSRPTKFLEESRMIKPDRILAWAIPTSILLFACSFSSAATETANTPAAAATSTPDPSGTILFEDDFSDDSKGWDVITDEYGTTAYADGVYLISVADSMSYLMADPDDPETYADVAIEVDFPASDATPHDMGVICRYQDDDNFYYLILASDGFYAIGKFVDGEDQLVDTEEMPADEDGVINQGAAANSMRAECVGSILTLYANGKKLIEVADTDFTKGSVGLIAGSYDDAPVNVFFDNFVVSIP
jgi:hypothetical protein